MKRAVIVLAAVVGAGGAVAMTGGGIDFGRLRNSAAAVSKSEPASSIGGPGAVGTVEGTSKTCLSADDISNALSGFTSEDAFKISQARTSLLNKSAESQSCRVEVVTALMSAMDRPNLDFTFDKDGYYLWRYGAELLGDLKATEALDLLVSHLGSVNKVTFSTSMNHRPAVKGVLKMGPAAIPKLNAVLRNNPDPEVRFYAVFCIASVGGPTAVSSLREVLVSESDECVRHIVSTSLESFDENGNLKDRSKWFSSLACD